MYCTHFNLNDRVVFADVSDIKDVIESEESKNYEKQLKDEVNTIMLKVKEEKKEKQNEKKGLLFIFKKLHKTVELSRLVTQYITLIKYTCGLYTMLI